MAKKRLNNAEKEYLLNELQKELSRRDFWEYCKLLEPDFYTGARPHLKRLCNTLQSFYESDKKVLIINEPPRHGKSFTMQLFATWIFGKNINEKIMTATYNERLATNFSKAVRNRISEEKADPNITVYSDIFPETKIKYGEAAANLWALEGAYSSYLATSPGGTATGFGASLLIVDDLIKNSYEAHSAKALEDQWAWLTTTMTSRLEKGGKIVIIATRWCNDDVSGHMLAEYKDAEVLIEKAVLDEKKKEMLCPSILDWDAYSDILSLAYDKNTIIANYQQITMDEANKTYHKEFKTYDPSELSEKQWEIYSYCDTADTGEDYLCNIIFLVDRPKRLTYILDVYYTQAPMEITEGAVADLYVKHNVYKALIESNNGGRGFARAVKRHLEDRGHWTTNIEWFTQTKNKLTRINTNASYAMERVLMPKNWQVAFPEFYKDLQRIQITGASLHDDCADALTGVAEVSQRLLNGTA